MRKYFQNIRRTSAAATLSNRGKRHSSIEIEEGAIPHREGARRIKPHKSESLLEVGIVA